MRPSGAGFLTGGGQENSPEILFQFDDKGALERDPHGLVDRQVQFEIRVFAELAVAAD